LIDSQVGPSRVSSADLAAGVDAFVDLFPRILMGALPITLLAERFLFFINQCLGNVHGKIAVERYTLDWSDSCAKISCGLEKQFERLYHSSIRKDTDGDNRRPRSWAMKELND
jgi:hypothetical protein